MFQITRRITLAFSCGARSAFKLNGKDYLRSMLSRRQLQGFVRQRVDRTAHRSRRYLPSKPSISKYANLPGTQDMSVPASMATVFDRASVKDISRLSMFGLSDITWHLSGAPFCLSNFSIAPSDCSLEGMSLAKRGSKSWQWLRPFRSFFLPRLDSSNDKYLARFSGITKARANCSS